MQRRILLPVLTSAGLLALALTGCSTGTLPGSATPGSGSTTTGSSQAPASSPFAVPKTCPSSAEIASILGVPEPPAPTQTATTDSLTCVYLSPTQDGVIVDIEPSNGITPAVIQAQVKAKGVAAGDVLVPGIGDTAYSLSKGGSIKGLYVLKGNSQLTIAGGQSLSGLEDLARKLLGL